MILKCQRDFFYHGIRLDFLFILIIRMCVHACAVFIFCYVYMCMQRNSPGIYFVLRNFLLILKVILFEYKLFSWITNSLRICVYIQDTIVANILKASERFRIKTVFRVRTIKENYELHCDFIIVQVVQYSKSTRRKIRSRFLKFLL